MVLPTRNLISRIYTPPTSYRGQLHIILYPDVLSIVHHEVLVKFLQRRLYVVNTSFRNYLGIRTPGQVNLKKIIMTILTLQEMFKEHL